MQIELPTSRSFSLTISDCPEQQSVYPTRRLMKGLLLSCNGKNLAEEAVGFGVPLLKHGMTTYFPGSLELTLVHVASPCEIRAVYTIDLVEKLSRPGGQTVEACYLYSVKNSLAALFRRIPPVRTALSTLSNRLRTTFRLQTTYEASEFTARVPVTFTYDEPSGVLAVAADFPPLPWATEAILMHEQGAAAFDRYSDSSGLSLQADAVGAWSEVQASEATFESSVHPIAFTVGQVPDARLFRGREMADSRLAWSGFAYSIPAAAGRFSCTVKLEGRS